VVGEAHRAGHRPERDAMAAASVRRTPDDTSHPGRLTPLATGVVRQTGPDPLDLGVHYKVYPARMALTVSALADTVGLSADTVRYYERVGLLPEPARSAAGYRLYDQTAVGRLRLIKGAQRAGLRGGGV